MELLTIGYEGLTLDGFFARLREAEVQTIFDVRQLPLSRKPGFSKNALREAAEVRGFAYRHLPPFGCPRPIRVDFKADGDWPCYVRRFCEYLDTQADAIERLARDAQRTRACLLCFEADPDTCHRVFVAHRAAQAAGGRLAVRHLWGGITVPKRPAPSARRSALADKSGR